MSSQFLTKILDLFARSQQAREAITIKTPNPKCRLYWCLIEFKDWSGDTISHVGIFDPLCELAPLYLLSSSPPVGLCGQHLQELHTVYLTRLRTYKIALTPQQNLGRPRYLGG
jgi:hypothetical protein